MELLFMELLFMERLLLDIPIKVYFALQNMLREQYKTFVCYMLDKSKQRNHRLNF